jgi:hypothetical protein
MHIFRIAFFSYNHAGPRLTGYETDDTVLSRSDVQAVLAGSPPTSNNTVLAAVANARTRWLSLHNFLARLWAARGISSLALNALEYNPPTSAGRPGATEALGPRALRIETAAIWLKTTAKEIVCE